jgi:hypothetical protein
MLTLNAEQIEIVRKALVFAGMELRYAMRVHINNGLEILAGDVATHIVRHEHAEHIMWELEDHFTAAAK